MAKGAYIGVSGVAHKVKKIYIGVDGVAHKVKKAYIGVNGVAKLFWSGGANKTFITVGNKLYQSTEELPTTFTETTDPTAGSNVYAPYIGYDKVNNRFICIQYKNSSYQSNLTTFLMPADGDTWTAITNSLAGNYTSLSYSMDDDGNLLVFPLSSSGGSYLQKYTVSSTAITHSINCQTGLTYDGRSKPIKLNGYYIVTGQYTSSNRKLQLAYTNNLNNAMTVVSFDASGTNCGYLRTPCYETAMCYYDGAYYLSRTTYNDSSNSRSITLFRGTDLSSMTGVMTKGATIGSLSVVQEQYASYFWKGKMYIEATQASNNDFPSVGTYYMTLSASPSFAKVNSNYINNQSAIIGDDTRIYRLAGGGNVGGYRFEYTTDGTTWTRVTLSGSGGKFIAKSAS